MNHQRLIEHVHMLDQRAQHLAQGGLVQQQKADDTEV
jgi:hypothetical protein